MLEHERIAHLGENYDYKSYSNNNFEKDEGDSKTTPTKQQL